MNRVEKYEQGKKNNIGQLMTITYNLTITKKIKAQFEIIFTI